MNSTIGGLALAVSTSLHAGVYVALSRAVGAKPRVAPSVVEIEVVYETPAVSPRPAVEPEPPPSTGSGAADRRPARRRDSIPGRPWQEPVLVAPPPPLPARSPAATEPLEAGLAFEPIRIEDPWDGDEQPGGELIFAEPQGGGEGEVAGEPSLGRGDLRHLVQERINYVASLLGADAVRRAGASGVAVVQIRSDRRGYVREAYLVRSTGTPALDRGIVPILHLAEPYPPWRGLLKVAVRFAPGPGAR